MSKTDFCSVVTVQLAVDMAAMVFNNGMMSFPTLIHHLGGVSENLGFFDNCDADRVRRADRESEIVTRRRVAHRQARKETEERNILAEGLMVLENFDFCEVQYVSIHLPFFKGSFQSHN